MQMHNVNIETNAQAATYVATGASRRPKPFGFLRPDENQALSWRRSR
jgi:hypothetical protein